MSNLDARINALRTFRVNARRNIERAGFGISDDIDRQRFIELQVAVIRGTQQEWEELNALVGRPLNERPVRLLPPAQRLSTVKATGIKRANATLVVKSIDSELREIVGIATPPGIDHCGDSVVAEGAQFRLPIPLLHQHVHDKPVGNVIDAAVTKAGISITARLAKVLEPGPLKDRVDTAWQEIKSGLVRGLSIGFHPIEQELLPSGKGIQVHEVAVA